MNIFLLLLVMVITFAIVLIGGKKFRFSALYTLAIGGAVNANYYNSAVYPINICSLPFGVDSIIYTLCVFSILIMMLEFSKKDAYVLTYSVVAAIVFAAIIEFITKIGSIGYSQEILISFAGYLISAGATMLAMWAMLELTDVLIKKNVNKYFIVIIALFVAMIINSFLYFGLTAIISGGLAENFVSLITASFIGKLLSTLFAVLIYFLLNLFNQKKERKDYDKIISSN